MESNDIQVVLSSSRRSERRKRLDEFVDRKANYRPGDRAQLARDMTSLAEELDSNAADERDLAESSKFIMLGGGGLTVLGVGGYFTLTAASVGTGIPFCFALAGSGAVGAGGGWLYQIRASRRARSQRDLATDLKYAADRLS